MKKIFLIVFVTLLTITTSCKDEELDRLDLKKITNGAFLRTISTDINEVDVYALAKSNSSVTLEFDDNKNHDSMESIDVFVKYTDTKTGNNGKLTKKDEVKLHTINPSVFKKENNGKPRAKITFDVAKAMEALGLTESNVDHYNKIVYRLALKMKDGRVFSSDNVRTSVKNSSAFKTPFSYTLDITVLKDATLTSSSKYFNFEKQKLATSTTADVEFSNPNIKATNVSDIKFLKMDLVLTAKEEASKAKLEKAVNEAKTDTAKEEAQKKLDKFNESYTKDNSKHKKKLFNQSDLSLKLKFVFDKGTPITEARNLKKGDLYAYKVTRGDATYFSLFRIDELKNNSLKINYRREQKSK